MWDFDHPPLLITNTNTSLTSTLSLKNPILTHLSNENQSHLFSSTWSLCLKTIGDQWIIFIYLTLTLSTFALIITTSQCHVHALDRLCWSNWKNYLCSGQKREKSDWQREERLVRVALNSESKLIIGMMMIIIREGLPGRYIITRSNISPWCYNK